MLLALILGISCGTWAALRQNKSTDYIVMATAMTGISIPNFVMAPLLVLFFAVQLNGCPRVATVMVVPRICCYRLLRWHYRRLPTSRD
jgi:oligopeptide transport system permease protein